MVTFRFDDPTYPLALVVFDRVNSTDPSFAKTWLLHSVQEPQIHDRTVTIVRDGKNPGTRATRMPEDANFGGKLVAECLMPAEASITKIGGPGKEFWVESAGRNFAPEIKRSKGRAFDPGVWRIEVSPSTEARSDRFLHVLSVMDLETEQGPEVQQVDAGNMVGALVHDRVALFSRNAEPVSELDFELRPAQPTPGSERLGVLVCDLQPGVYEVQRNGETTTQRLTATAEGTCVYFKAAPGRYRLEKVSENTPAAKSEGFWQKLRESR